MADLSEKQASASTKIVGADPSTGAETNYAGVNADGTLQSLAYGRTEGGVSTPVKVDTAGRLVTTPDLTAPPASLKVRATRQIAAGGVDFQEFLMSQRIAFKQFTLGGMGIGTAALTKYVAATEAFVTGGDFETALAPWVESGAGGNGYTASQSSDFAFTGTKSAKIVHSKSDVNNYPQITQTFGSPVDYSAWRKITARFYHLTPAGALVARTISIILTDVTGNTRTYSVTGTSGSGVFINGTWVQIVSDLENPTSSTGTSFDLTQVASISLRCVDGANRAGTVYWDTVKVTGAITMLFKLYTKPGDSFNLPLDPVEIFEIGETLLLITKNTEATTKEYTTLAAGVVI